MTLQNGRGVAHCFRCQYVETTAGTVSCGDVAEQALTSTVHVRLSDYGEKLWKECGRLDGSARSYLLARRCLLPPEDGDLRYHDGLKHPTGYVGPAMVALITDAITGEALSLHRTWVRGDGTKAANPPRLLLKGHRKQGGVIRLWPDDAVTTGLAIAEGIETALTIAHGFQPVWAVIDAGNLAAFPVLEGIETLTICADHDDAGLSAAQTCARRWSEAGREVRVVTPMDPKTDFNDLGVAA